MSTWISLRGLSVCVRPTLHGISSGTFKKLVHFNLNSKLLTWDIASALSHSVLTFLVRMNPKTLWLFLKIPIICYNSEKVEINRWKTATHEPPSKHHRKEPRTQPHVPGWCRSPHSQ